MGLLALVPLCDRRGIAAISGAAATRWLGLVLTLAAGGLVFGSVLNLGRQYSARVTLQPEHHLVTSGLYRFIRHPRYLGLLGMVLGFALVFNTWVGAAADLALLAGLLWRISDEKNLLRGEFGQEWEDYARRTKRLIPGIW